MFSSPITLNPLELISKIYIGSIRFTSHLLEVIGKNYIETFIRIETFSNSGQFQHRVVYMGASIIRRFKAPPGRYSWMVSSHIFERKLNVEIVHTRERIWEWSPNHTLSSFHLHLTFGTLFITTSLYTSQVR